MISKIVVLLCVLYFVCVNGDEPNSGGYDTKYDNIDLNALLKNDRLRKNYVKCLLNEGPCTPDAMELKNSLPDAIATNCSKCTEKQKNGSEIVTHYLIDNQPEEWERLAAIYDKDDEYKRNYLDTKTEQPETKTNDE